MSDETSIYLVKRVEYLASNLKEAEIERRRLFLQNNELNTKIDNLCEDALKDNSKEKDLIKDLKSKIESLTASNELFKVMKLKNDNVDNLKEEIVRLKEKVNSISLTDSEKIYESIVDRCKHIPEVKEVNFVPKEPVNIGLVNQILKIANEKYCAYSKDDKKMAVGLDKMLIEIGSLARKILANNKEQVELKEPVKEVVVVSKVPVKKFNISIGKIDEFGDPVKDPNDSSFSTDDALSEIVYLSKRRVIQSNNVIGEESIIVLLNALIDIEKLANNIIIDRKSEGVKVCQELNERAELIIKQSQEIQRLKDEPVEIFDELKMRDAVIKAQEKKIIDLQNKIGNIDNQPVDDMVNEILKISKKRGQTTDFNPTGPGGIAVRLSNRLKEIEILANTIMNSSVLPKEVVKEKVPSKYGTLTSPYQELSLEADAESNSIAQIRVEADANPVPEEEVDSEDNDDYAGVMASHLRNKD